MDTNRTKKTPIYYPTLDAARSSDKIDSKTVEIWQIRDRVGDEHYILSRIFFGKSGMIREIEAHYGFAILRKHNLRSDEQVKIDDETRASTVSIRLSSRGWGDYIPLSWSGDIRRPQAEIVAECRALLKDGHDVDHRDLTDEAILALIDGTRKKIMTSVEPYTEPDRGAGYCHNCETYCYGDCGQDPRG